MNPPEILVVIGLLLYALLHAVTRRKRYRESDRWLAEYFRSFNKPNKRPTIYENPHRTHIHR